MCILTGAGSGKLTSSALHLHDASQVDDGRLQLDALSQASSFDAVTFKTWASNYTDCSNIAFSRVHRLWNSSSALHKEVGYVSLVIAKCMHFSSYIQYTSRIE